MLHRNSVVFDRVATRLSTLMLLLVLDAHLANAYSFPPTGIFAEKNSTLNP